MFQKRDAHRVRPATYTATYRKAVRWSSVLGGGMRCGRPNNVPIVAPRRTGVLPQMRHFFLAQVGDFFTGRVCFDTSYALLGSRSALGNRGPGHCGRAVPVGPPSALTLAASLQMNNASNRPDGEGHSGSWIRTSENSPSETVRKASEAPVAWPYRAPRRPFSTIWPSS